MTLCSNVTHNLSWNARGLVNPCNNLIGFPSSSTVELMRSSRAYQDLSNDNNNDLKSKFCQRCWDKEQLGMTSKRQSDNAIDQVYSKIDSDYIKIDAAVGDVCNAACRICGPDSSTLWQKIEIGWQKSNIENQVWKYANDQADHLLQLDFGGGEPWLNHVPEQVSLFEKLIKQGQQDVVKIRYNTNGSLWPTKLINRLKRFREVEITLSLDDIENRFEYNRWPLKWNKVEKNIKKFVELQHQSNIKITVNFTVSIFTWQRAQAFKQWAQSQNLNKINFNILNDPWVYSIKSLPSQFKNKLPATQFDNIVSTQEKQDWFTEFMQATKKLDQQRGQSFVETFPELKSIL